MNFAKYVFILIASLIVFGLFGGFDPSNTVGELFIKSVVTGLVFASVLVLNEVKTQIFTRI